MTKAENAVNFSMLALRLILGAIFIAHGAQKLFGMFGGIGIEGTAQMMEGLGFPYPYVSAFIWSGIEFFSGIFIIMGILTRYFAALVAIVMLVSIWKINLAYGFFVQNGGYEYNLLIIGACLPLVFIGGGGWSVWDI